jgi:lipopolysaccharide export system protein LptA
MVMLKQKLIFLVFRVLALALIIYNLAYSVAIFGNSSSQLHISSDDLILNKNAQTAKFDGTVIIWFDDMVVKTSTMTVLYKTLSGQQNVERIIMPAKLTALCTSTQDTIIANSAIYIRDTSELILTGDIKLAYEDYVLSTEKLLYYTKLKKIDHNSRSVIDNTDQ